MDAKAREIAQRIERDAFDAWTMNKEQKQYMGAFDLDEAESIIAEALAEKDAEIARPDCTKCEWFSESAEFSECDDCMWSPAFSNRYKLVTISPDEPKEVKP